MASEFERHVLYIFGVVVLVAVIGCIWTLKSSSNVGYFALNDACPLGTNINDSCITEITCDNSIIQYKYYPETGDVSMHFINAEGISYFLTADDLKQDSQTLISIEGPHILQGQRFVITNDYTTRIIKYIGMNYTSNKAIFEEPAGVYSNNITANVTPFTGTDATTGYYGKGTLPMADGKIILNFVVNALGQIDGDLNQNDKFHEITEIPLKLQDNSTQMISTLRTGCPDSAIPLPPAAPASNCYTRITNITLNPANPAGIINSTADNPVELDFQISTAVNDSAKFYDSAFKYTVVDPFGNQVNSPDYTVMDPDGVPYPGYPIGTTENTYDYQGQIPYDNVTGAKWVGVYLGHMNSSAVAGHMIMGNYTITLFGFPFMSDIDPNGYYTSDCDGVTNETNYDSWQIVVDIFDNLPNPPVLRVSPISTPFEVNHSTTSVPIPAPSEPTTPTEPTDTGCADTDGNDPYTSGTVTTSTDVGIDTCVTITPATLSTPAVYTGVNTCTGTTCFVNEKTCKTGGNGIPYIGGEYIQCADGCNNGICASTTTNTTPTGPVSIFVNSIESVGQNKADGVLEDGLDFRFSVTLPENENQLTARFADWEVDGNPAFATLDNTFVSYKGVNYKVDSASNYGMSDTLAVTDENSGAAGIQVTFDVLARIPVNTTLGNFTSAFGLKSLPEGGA